MIQEQQQQIKPKGKTCFPFTNVILVEREWGSGCGEAGAKVYKHKASGWMTRHKPLSNSGGCLSQEA